MNRDDLLTKVHQHIKFAAKLDVDRYEQEPAYVAAFLGRLQGEINLGSENGMIEFQLTIVNDRGPGCAENIYGADFCVTFKSTGGLEDVSKALIAQAKKGCADNLSGAERDKLIGQCIKMQSRTDHYLVFEVPEISNGIPTVRIGRQDTIVWSDDRIPIDEYIVDYLIGCSHGDRRQNFINAVQRSDLTGLSVVTRGLTLDLDPPVHRY